MEHVRFYRLIHSGSSICAANPCGSLAFQLSPQVGFSCHYLREDVQRGFNVVFNMDLPQTAPGVPAPGIDPNLEDLQAVNTVAEMLVWLGTSEAASKSLFGALGTSAPKLRDIVYIRGGDYDHMLTQITITEGENTRAPTPIEAGHFHQLRRICRLRLGLPAIEVSSGLPPLGTVGFGPEPATQGDALASQGGTSALGKPTVSTEPRLKLSVILDPSLDSELVRMPLNIIRNLFTTYEKVRGAEPAEDVEPTVEQISAVNQVLQADLIPYADFALLGPYGRRLVGKLSYLSWSFQPDGTWVRRELPGPPSLEHWWASSRVVRVVYLLLDVAPPEVLDNYGELIRGFHSTYGSACWFLIYIADVRMRSEQFERIRRHAERDHQQATSLGLSSTFDVTKPWHTVFSKALSDKLWWDENLHRPAILYLTRIKSASETVADGTVQDIPGPSPAPSRQRSRSRGGGGGGNRRQQASHPRQRESGNGIYTKAGQALCEAFNSAAGCSRGGRCNDHHSCKKCRQCDHGAANCNFDKIKLTPNNHCNVPPPPAPYRDDRKRRGKRGGKGGKR